MEEEIDLRPYVLTLVKNWKWIVSIPLAMAIIAFAISAFAVPLSYSATAIVAVVASKDSIRLDSSIVETAGKQPLSAFPDLALSDEVLNNLLDNLTLEESMSISKLREKLDAGSGKDNSVIILTTTFKDPELAAQVANTWAESFVSWANRLYAGQSEEQVLFFEDQLAIAEQDLSHVEATIEEFQIINQTQIISSTLAVFQQRHTDFLLQQSRIDQLLDNTNALRDQMVNQSASVDISYTDQLTFLQLQLQSFNNEPVLPIILQVDSQETLTTKNRSSHIEMIDGLIGTLREKAAQVEINLTEIEPQILTLQQDKQTSLIELSRLNQDLNIARQTHTALAYQVAEERIASRDSSSGFQLASRAVIPAESVSGPIIPTVIAAILGVALSLFVVFIIEWWRMGNNTLLISNHIRETQA